MKARPTILVADDHEVVRLGLAAVLEEKFAGASLVQACSFNSCRQLLSERSFDLLILDLIMPDGNGLEFLKEVHHLYPQLPVLVLSVHSEEDYALRSLRAGAVSFMSKDCSLEELARAISAALQGKRYLRAETAGRLIDHLLKEGQQPAHHNLSDRELEVLELLAQGKTIAMIGNFLQLSPKTISTYRNRLMQKLHLQTDTELVRYCLEHRLIH